MRIKSIVIGKQSVTVTWDTAEAPFLMAGGPTMRYRTSNPRGFAAYFLHCAPIAF